MFLVHKCKNCNAGTVRKCCGQCEADCNHRFMVLSTHGFKNLLVCRDCGYETHGQYTYLLPYRDFSKAKV